MVQKRAKDKSKNSPTGLVFLDIKIISRLLNSRPDP